MKLGTTEELAGIVSRFIGRGVMPAPPPIIGRPKKNGQRSHWHGPRRPQKSRNGLSKTDTAAYMRLWRAERKLEKLP
jgi:hypothetical protein